MADNGAENLRKQIAFLSNLIHSHKSSKQNDKPVVKTIASNSKQNKTWSIWNGRSKVNQHSLDKNRQPNEGTQQIETGKHRLPSNNRNVQQSTNKQKSSSNTKYSLHRKPTTMKLAPPGIFAQKSSSRTTNMTQKYSSSLPTKTQFKVASGSSSSGHAIRKNVISTSVRPQGNLKWTKNKTKPEVDYSTSSEESKELSCKTPSKYHLSSASTGRKAIAKAASLPTLSAANTRKTVPLPNSHKSISKTASLSHLDNLKISQSILDQRTSSQQRPSYPLTKTTSLPIRSSRVVCLPKNQNTNLINTNTSSVLQSSTSLDRIVKLPKSHATSSDVFNNNFTNTRQLEVNQRRVTLPKSLGIASTVSNKLGKTNPSSSTISKGAKLKWRRRSSSYLKNDLLSKNNRSKNLFGNKLQAKIALKTTWKKTRPTFIRLKRTVPTLRANYPRTRAGQISKNTKVRKIHSPYTRAILQSRNLPRRSRLKWSKSLHASSSSVKNNPAIVKSKPKFAHNSRFSLKRRKSSEGKSLGGYAQGSSRVHSTTEYIKKVRLQNQGFVARRMKYIALGSRTQNRSPLSKYLSKTSAQPQLRRKVKIGGSVYLISSHGKTLTKTASSTKTTFTSCQPRHLLRVYRRPSVASSSDSAIKRIFKRQSSVNSYKSRKANKILKRTLQNVQALMRKRKSKSEEYCMFYNKFGKCTKHSQGLCPYIHDLTKIAVCTRFLRGKCEKMDGTCPFSHKVDKEKMPICQYFLKGKCNRDDCPYSHVNVGSQAVVCEDFLKGYCALGFKCTKKHVLECEEFSMTGECPNRSKCKLIHRKKVLRKRYFDEDTSIDEEDNACRVKKYRRKSSDGFLPLEDSNTSEDEHAAQPHDSEDRTESNSSMRIRPNFGARRHAGGEQ